MLSYGWVLKFLCQVIDQNFKFCKYVVGGFDGNTMVPTVEIFDPRIGSWMSGEPMNYLRGYSVSAVVNDTIYVIGGVKDGHNIVDAVSSMSNSFLLYRQVYTVY